MNLTELCIRRPVLAWMIMASTILFGLVATSRLGVSQMPDVDSPNVTVSLSWPGAAPEEVEHGIIEPLEQALAQVEGVQEIQATARVGSARLTAVFALGPTSTSPSKTCRPRSRRPSGGSRRTSSSRPSRRATPTTGPF
jgi:multidrug efflux pump subunit AcrB